MKRFRVEAVGPFEEIVIGDERTDHFDNQLDDGQIRVRALLSVDETDLDRASVDSGDGPSRIEPIAFEKVLRIEGFDRDLNGISDLKSVVVETLDGNWNNIARNEWEGASDSSRKSPDADPSCPRPWRRRPAYWH